MQRYFIAGIGTDVGKTIAAAVLAQAWGADYWKPIQSGAVEGLDSDIVGSLVSNNNSKIHSETYTLKDFSAPHIAAAKENIKIDLNKIKVPETSNNLLIEGAGGLLVPLNEIQTVADLIRQFNTPVILVCRAYLGAINHTLLSLQYLLNNDLPVKGLVFNADKDGELEKIILKFKKLPVLLRMDLAETLNQEFIVSQAKKVL